jgi:hypothetical protein
MKKTTPEDVHKAFKKVMKRAKFPKQTPFFPTEGITPELRAAINDPEKFKQYLKEQESQRTTIRTAGGHRIRTAGFSAYLFLHFYYIIMLLNRIYRDLI